MPKAKDSSSSSTPEEIYGELFGEPGSKSQKTVLQIIEAAIRSYASVGFEKTSYERLAKACRLSRPLLHHYFKDKRDLFIAASRYIRVHFQAAAIQAIREQANPKNQLEAYIRVHLDWSERFPDHAAVWALFYYYASIDKKLRRLNTEMVAAGQARIGALLGPGSEDRARDLQLYLTGVVVSLATEDVADRSSVQKKITAKCFDLINQKNN